MVVVGNALSMITSVWLSAAVVQSLRAERLRLRRCCPGRTWECACRGLVAVRAGAGAGAGRGLKGFCSHEQILANHRLQLLDVEKALRFFVRTNKYSLITAALRCRKSLEISFFFLLTIARICYLFQFEEIEAPQAGDNAQAGGNASEERQ